MTPLNSVPDVKSLMSPGETVDPAASPVTVRVGGAAPGRPCSDAAAESALLKQSKFVPSVTSNACIGTV